RLLARVRQGRGESPGRAGPRGAGARGPRGRLAAELTAAAARARAAGDPAFACALAERAAALSTDPRERSRLLGHAAADAWLAGEGDRSRALAARTDADAVTGVLALRTGHAGEAFDALLAGAARAATPRTTPARAATPRTARATLAPAAGPRPTSEVVSSAGDGAGAPSECAGPAADGFGPRVGRGAGVGSGEPAGPGSASRVPGGTAADAGTQARVGASAAVAASASTEAAGHLLARAAEAAVYTGDLRRCHEAVLAAREAGIDPPGVLGGLAAAVDGRYEDARDLLEATAGRCGPGGDPTLLIHSGIAALMLGDHTRAATAAVRAAAAARARGVTVLVSQAMEFRAYADFWTGRPHAAEAAALDALRQAYATGQDNGACHLQAALAMFAALTGDGELCRERAATARSYALAHGLGLPAALAQWALAFLDLGNGRYDAAATKLRALAASGPGHGHRAVRHLATPHYVEAAVRTGYTRVAHTAHADYDRWARAVGSPDDLALSARCRALLTPGAEALQHYGAALDLHADGDRAFERARTELLFGSALRRLRRRAEARDRLHSALQAFESFGAPHCAQGARAELRALGAPGASTRGGERPTTHLTAQQLLIARMAADGATNREIAARLALSPRTIDHHLRGVFTRLGIRSRIDLVRLLADGEQP
ncbi:LuxR C-terminal-related transcriptional regulator, partial [Streptomyces sp. NPDC058291]|uniref:LuxR C-terminal-related transcriptional regulator n=1 Tax=Streptomyces sp. NPDC058291 TaxID=3346427 RepID=UPI0036E15F98